MSIFADKLGAFERAVRESSHKLATEANHHRVVTLRNELISTHERPPFITDRSEAELYLRNDGPLKAWHEMTGALQRMKHDLDEWAGGKPRSRSLDEARTDIAAALKAAGMKI